MPRCFLLLLLRFIVSLLLCLSKLTVVFLSSLTKPHQDALCPPQLILEEEGLTRIAQTIQALLEIPSSGVRRPSRPDPSGLPSQDGTS